MVHRASIARLTLVAAALLTLVAAALLAGCGSDRTPSGESLTYVGRSACSGCHEAEAMLWSGSHHDRAMEEASEESVLGNFENSVFEECGKETRFLRHDDRYLVSTEGRHGAVDTFTVRYTFGFTPLQQYLLEFPNGRLQAFTVAWDATQNRWFSLYPDECFAPDDALHWTGPAMNWNYMCASCHSTDLQRNYDLATDTYRTTYAEIDVSCEACHGPGSAHATWAGRRSGDRRLAADSRGEDRAPSSRDMGLVVDLKAPGNTTQIETCAPCHSRRREIYPDYHAGEAFLDYFEPELVREDLYFPDGQIRDEVYVYGSFLQSEMYRRSVRCSDCHEPHSLRLRAEGNDLCTQCHEPTRFDRPEHLQHPAESSGAECVGCHMPARTYMVVDPRRDHSFRIPQPERAEELATPNACNNCHDDRSAAWAAAFTQEWYGRSEPSETRRRRERDLEIDVARTFHAAWRREAGLGAGVEERLQRAAELHPAAIMRASSIDILSQYDNPITITAATAALGDSSAIVRAAAVRALDGRIASSELARVLRPLLEDTVRLVRTEAARVLARTAAGQFSRDSPAGNAFWSALQEYQTGLQSLAEQPASHLNLGLVHEGLRQDEEALEAYRTALRLDTTFVPAHLNTAMLLNRRRTEMLSAGRVGDAQQYYDRALEELQTTVRIQPELAGAHYSLGLLLAEDPDRLEEAAVHLSTAAELDPDNSRMQYNAGLAHQHLGQADEAEAFLLRANRIDPEEATFLNALSIFYAQRQNWPEARSYTERLLELHPNDPELHQRLNHIERQFQGP